MKQIVLYSDGTVREATSNVVVDELVYGMFEFTPLTFNEDDIIIDSYLACLVGKTLDEAVEMIKSFHLAKEIENKETLFEKLAKLPDEFEYKPMQYYSYRLKEPEVLFKFSHDNYEALGLNLGTHPCAYVGVRLDSLLANLDIDEMPLRVHGGVTYSGCGFDIPAFTKGRYWYGWDYAHSSDYMGGMSSKSRLKKWSTEEIILHCIDAIEQLQSFEEIAKYYSERRSS